MTPSSEIVQLLEFDKIAAALRERATSALGRERLDAIEFSHDRKVVQRRLDEVTELRQLLDSDEGFPLDQVWDLRPALRRASAPGTYLGPEELLQISQTVACARRVRRYLGERRDRSPALWDWANRLQSFHDIEVQVENAIDPSTFEVKSGASTKLRRIRSRIVDTEEEMRHRLSSMVKALSGKDVLQEEVVTLREGRFVLPVRSEHRNRVPGLIHDQSATGQTLFVEPFEAVELNNRLRQLRAEERQEIVRILTALTDLVRAHAEGLQVDVEVLGELDAIYAKALLSRDLQAAAPSLSQKGELELIDARHPLLLLRHEKRDAVVPLNMRLPPDIRTLVITGPNAGGKTVALKAVGLLVLMTQCGLHIPASPDSTLPLMQALFADIGDTQSIEQDLSTFTSHMQRIRRILLEATASSLVLIDEIGAGTDPKEGAALAVAVLEELTRRGCKTVVTTHLGELKAFANDTPGVENGSMEFDAETLEPTYRFRLGLPGSSYAFEIARRQGLPDTVIDRGRELLGEERGRLDRLIAEFEQKSQEIDRRLSELRSEHERLRRMMQEYEQRLQVVREQQRTARRQAAEEAERILKEANRAVEQAIREIREKSATHEAIKAAKERLTQQRQEVDRILEEETKEEIARAATKPLGPIRLGDSVLWRRQNVEGQVVSAPDSGDRVLVQIGRVKMRVPVSELERIAKEPAKPAPTFRAQRPPKPDVQPEIDVRGMRVDEALAVVDKFLDDAYLAGWKEVRIIHGKGTGALRQAVGELLDSHPRVAGRRAAAWNEGDLGVTVVEFAD